MLDGCIYVKKPRLNRLIVIMKSMRYILPLLLLFSAGATLLQAQTASDYFSALSIRASGDAIVVQWTSVREDGLTSYEVQRRDAETPIYVRIGTVDLKGSGSRYTYVDNSAFNKPSEAKQYTYRIRATTRNGSTYSQILTISHDVSSVRKSWGMIKELFR